MRWLSFERDGKASFGRVVDGGVVDAGSRTGIPTLKVAIAPEIRSALMAYADEQGQDWVGREG